MHASLCNRCTLLKLQYECRVLGQRAMLAAHWLRSAPAAEQQGQTPFWPR